MPYTFSTGAGRHARMVAPAFRGSWALTLLVAGLLLHILPTPSSAQGRLVPLVTDRTPLPLSNHFGVASSSDVNEAGDYALIGNADTALFLRRAGGNTFVRVHQAGEEVPGFPGSRGQTVSGASLNASGVLAFTAYFYDPSGVARDAILVYEGASYRRLAFSADPAPGCGEARFEVGFSLIGINDAGDVAFSATLGSIQRTLFIAPAGGAPVRIAGPGDAAAGTTGTFTSVAAMGFNNRGEVLFGAPVSGGAGGGGLFIGTTASVRKVVANGDAAPGGGTFSFPAAPTSALLNNAGTVAFAGNEAIWVYSPETGISRVVGSGDGTPAGTLSAPTMRALSDSGAIAFNARSGGTDTLFRFTPGTCPIEVVARGRQPAPGTEHGTFSGTWAAISINGTGAVSFIAILNGSPASQGLFQQAGSSLPIPMVLQGQSTTLQGGGTYGLMPTGNWASTTRTLESGAVWFRATVVAGGATFGEFLVAATGTRVLMSTEDELPAGSNILLRTFRPSGAGDYVGFAAQRSGGQFSVVVRNLATQTTSVVVTEGDQVPSGRIQTMRARSSIFLNARGAVALSAQIAGGPGAVPGTSSAILLAREGAVTKIAGAGDTEPVSGGTFESVSLPLYVPAPLNDAGQVVFFGSVFTGIPGSYPKGLFVGSEGAPVKRVAVTGQTAPGGRPFYNLNVNDSSPAINESGQVAFVATTGTSTSQRRGIYLFTPTSNPELQKIVEPDDPGPAGTKFVGLAYPSLNNPGQVAFMATLAGSPLGGPTGGVFVGSPSGLASLALDGELAPAGGSFSIATARPDVQMNDQGDVVFRADLKQGTSDSGYFLRRGSSGLVEKLVLQGEAAPGTGTTFLTMPLSMNDFVSEFAVLDGLGNVALSLRYQDADGRKVGFWHVAPEGTLEQVLVKGVVSPEFGGGAAVVSTMSTAWNSDGRFPLFARITGGTFTDGMFLFVPSSGVATPSGSLVVVRPPDQTTGQTLASVTFDNVTAPGITTLATSAAGPTLPAAVVLGDPALFYNIATTAAFSGEVTVCLDFNAGSFPDASGLRLLHFEDGNWIDVTIGAGPVGSTICGRVSFLSPFVLGKITEPPTLTATVTPNVLWPANNKLVQITASIEAVGVVGPSPRVELVSISSNEPLSPDDVRGASVGTDCRTFELRAARLGGGSGRIYTIRYRATDAAGNAVERTAHVVVPHDQRTP